MSPARVWIAACLLFAPVSRADPAGPPRIVNVYNFVRNSDFRVPNSEDVLYDCTAKRLELFKRVELPVTWALQYDAMINPRYQKLLKERLGPKDEIGAWWEIPRPLGEKAGLEWRGRWDWDSASNVGFSPGYTLHGGYWNQAYYRVDGVDFKLKTAADHGVCSQADDGTIRIKSGHDGSVVLVLGTSS